MLLCARPLWKDRAARGVLLLLGTFYIGAALEARLFPHYVAPAAALVYVLVGFTLRAARNSWPGTLNERVYLTGALMIAFVAISLFGLLTPENRYLFGPIDYHVRAKHASIAERLEHEPGDHLVLVRYGSQHELYEELVYNRADIDHSRIIWARSLGPDKDQKLIQHYPGRHVWLVEDSQGLRLSGYATQQEKRTMLAQLPLQVTSRF
jgi:hypothetical protein